MERHVHSPERLPEASSVFKRSVHVRDAVDLRAKSVGPPTENGHRMSARDEAIDNVTPDEAITPDNRGLQRRGPPCDASADSYRARTRRLTPESNDERGRSA